VEEVRMSDLASAVISIAGSKSGAELASRRADDPMRRKPSIELARAELGWNPKTSLTAGLGELMRHFEDKVTDRACLPLVVLVTATDRPHLHLDRTIPSLRRQTRGWDAIVVVDDSKDSAAAIRENFGSAGLAGLSIIQNSRAKGAAGAWNTGLDYIRANIGEAWVAILDDDDEWEADHLRSCLTQTSEKVDAVIAGIITYVDGVRASIAMHEKFKPGEFLRHNPGWQGSNTFVRLSMLEKAGRFDEALACTHDRDLAIRLLNMADFIHVRTGLDTVKYHISASEPAYTRRLNPIKLQGLRAFWGKHRQRMSPSDEAAFFSHAADMFGFSRQHITH